MTKRKPTKHEDDVRRNLRKSAEINPAQSPHHGIHTCSKGCKKPGCNRGLRDTIEEQDAQIEALKQDLLEQAAAVRNSRMANIHDLGYLGEKSAEIASLKAELDQLNQRVQDPYRLSNGWQPIETAPKDGTLVLLFEDGVQYIAHWAETAGGQFFNDAEYQHNPTHWMPLPKPPIK